MPLKAGEVSVCLNRERSVCPVLGLLLQHTSGAALPGQRAQKPPPDQWRVLYVDFTESNWTGSAFVSCVPRQTIEAITLFLLQKRVMFYKHFSNIMT